MPKKTVGSQKSVGRRRRLVFNEENTVVAIDRDPGWGVPETGQAAARCKMRAAKCVKCCKMRRAEAAWRVILIGCPAVLECWTRCGRNSRKKPLWSACVWFQRSEKRDPE